MTFTSVFELSSLDGSNGFKLGGELAGDRSGRSVASAGDVNGDGIDDLIIGAFMADPNGLASGATYVVFGTNSPFPANFDLSALDGSNGFQINGEAASDFSGFSVASAGDINGDGFDDLIIGAPYNSGASYVVFGTDSPFVANLDLSTLDGSNGFQINGEAAGDLSGLSVASAGDINGDGFDDLIIGAYRADPNGFTSGASYVVFGTDSGFDANLELSTLDGSNGFQINGEATSDFSGFSVATAGDINGDGFDDLIIGAPNAHPNGSSSGASYMVFGTNSGFDANLELPTLDGSNGFQINGEAAVDFSGSSVASAGDVNGDGFDDLIIGARYADPNGYASGASYVVFGKLAGFDANFELSTLDGTNGFQINGELTGDVSGWSVASAGDVNGDGFDDLIIGAFGADPNGDRSGASYVVFGKTSGFDANFDLSTLDGENGFQINGEAAIDFSGFSVASAGDVNGDGFDDLIIGAYFADANGTYSGASYVVFGGPSTSNQPPVITSNGGGDSASVTVPQQTTAVTIVAATDPDAGQTMAYTITGGADAGKFTIDGATGALAFLTAPKYGQPTDAGGNNVYDVTVQASDGNGGIDTQAIAVTVTNKQNEKPVITSDGGGATATISVAENSTAVTTVTTIDPNAGQTLNYSIQGPDAAQFTIDASTGVLAFLTAPDYENPTDVSADNAYHVIVTVSDGSLADSQVLTVNVTDVSSETLTAVGADADTFNFDATIETRKGITHREMISGFAHGEDHIYRHDIDAGSNRAHDQDFGSIGATAFHRHAGGLLFVSQAAGWGERSIHDDGTADFQIEMNGVTKVFADDFIL